MKTEVECTLQNLRSGMQNGMEWNEMVLSAGESKTTAITAVSIGTDGDTLGLTVIHEFLQHTRFLNNSNRTNRRLN